MIPGIASAFTANALDLLLYTGLSRGDVVRLGRQHVNNGVITFRMEKGRGDGVVSPARAAGLGGNDRGMENG